MAYDEDLLRRDYLPEVIKRYSDAHRPLPSTVAEAFVWFTRQGFDVGVGEAYETAKARHLKELEDELGLTPPAPLPPTGGPCRPLDGFLRLFGRSFGDGQSVASPRTVRFYSWFAGLRILADDESEFKRQLDRVMGYWQGLRLGWNIRGIPWAGYGLDFDIRRPDADALIRRGLELCWERGLRVASTNFDFYNLGTTAEQQALYARVAQLCASVNPQVVALSSVINEPDMTSPYGADWSRYADLCAIWQQHYPWGQHGTGCGGGDPEAYEVDGQPGPLVLAQRGPATVTLKQGTRADALKAIHRMFDVAYENRGQVKPIVEEEGTGNENPNAVHSVYQAMQNRNDLFGYWTMALITGQMLIPIQGPSLWTREPIDACWGFKEIPQLWADMGLPEDVGQWRIGHLHNSPITGSGFDRLEGAWNEPRGEAISVGVGGWNPEARSARWDAEARIYRGVGLLDIRQVQAGERIFSEGGKPETVVIYLRRR